MSHHVLFITYHLPLKGEPGSFRPWMEAKLMIECGYSVTVITSGVQYMTGQDIRGGRGWCAAQELEGVRILRTWAPANHRRSLVRRAVNYLAYTTLAACAAFTRVRRVDRVFAGTDPIIMMPMVYLVSLFKRAPMVLDERDLFPETAVALGVIKEGVLSGTLSRLQKFFRGRACGILTATPGIREHILRERPSANVSLLYNADVFLQKPGKGSGENSRCLRKLTGKRFLVGYAGGLGRANDIFTLLRAAGKLRDLEDLGVVIIGDGEFGSLYEEYCRKQKLERVYFLGALPRDETRSLIGQLDLCVQLLPNHPYFAVTLTSKTFDYLGLGKPLVCCAQGDTARLLKESGGGVIAEPGDHDGLATAIRLLYSDPEMRRRMGEAGARWYSQNIRIESARDVIQRVISCG